jgi:hypothetical protein
MWHPGRPGRRQAAGSRRQAAGSRQQAAGGRQQAAGGRANHRALVDSADLTATRLDALTQTAG